MADLGDKLDKLEETKDALANKKISVLGFSFSWTQLVVAAGVVSSACLLYTSPSPRDS